MLAPAVVPPDSADPPPVKKGEEKYVLKVFFSGFLLGFEVVWSVRHIPGVPLDLFSYKLVASLVLRHFLARFSAGTFCAFARANCQGYRRNLRVSLRQPQQKVEATRSQ